MWHKTHSIEEDEGEAFRLDKWIWREIEWQFHGNRLTMIVWRQFGLLKTRAFLEYCSRDNKKVHYFFS